MYYKPPLTPNWRSLRQVKNEKSTYSTKNCSVHIKPAPYHVLEYIIQDGFFLKDAKTVSVTRSRFPERGSISLIFLSLQVVARRLQSVLKDMERTTSVWWLMVFTGFLMSCSGQSRFQIMIWRWGGGRRTHLMTYVCVITTFTIIFSISVISKESQRFDGAAVITEALTVLNSVHHLYPCWRYLVVVARTEQDVVSSRVPLDETHSTTVTLKFFHRHGEVLQQTREWDFPHFDLQTHIFVR